MIKNFLKILYKYWMSFAKKLSIIPTTIILFMVYFGAISIIAIINFILRKDILKKGPLDRGSFWLDKEHIAVDFERCKRQF